MADIIPAIMPKTLADLEEHVARVAGAVETVQIDVMDGNFVKPKTWPYIRHDVYFDEIVSEERGLPMWDQIDYEVDLMVKDPIVEGENWMKAGAARLVAHIESFVDEKSIQTFLGYKSEFVEVALAIGVETPIEKIEPFLNDISCVQCMGIKRIGYQGEPFDERVVEQIKKIRAKAPDIDISVDGGVSSETAHVLVGAGATRLVSGSAIFESTNPHEAIRELKRL